MKKKIIVSLAALLVLAVSVIGFYSIQAVGDNTPKVEAIDPVTYFLIKSYACEDACAGAHTYIYDSCYHDCLRN